METTTLILNNRKYRYRIHANQNSDQYGILLLGALQDIESVDYFSKYFSSSINCITVEVPGTGRTDVLPASFSIHDQATMLLEFANFFEIKNAHIFAFSYATAIAVELCNVWKGVSSLSICGGVPGIPNSGRDATMEMIADSIRDKKKFAKTFTQSLMIDNPDIPRNSAIKRVTIKNICSLNANRISSFLENSIRLLVHKPKNIETINVPCSISVGEYDPYVTTKAAFEFSQQLQNSYFTIIKNADHFVHLEQPESVAEAMILLSKNQASIADKFKAIENNLC